MKDKIEQQRKKVEQLQKINDELASKLSKYQQNTNFERTIKT